MTADDIIEEVGSREIAVQCDRFVIDGIPIYFYVRRSLYCNRREEVLQLV